LCRRLRNGRLRGGLYRTNGGLRGRLGGRRLGGSGLCRRLHNGGLRGRLGGRRLGGGTLRLGGLAVNPDIGIRSQGEFYPGGLGKVGNPVRGSGYAPDYGNFYFFSGLGIDYLYFGIEREAGMAHSESVGLHFMGNLPCLAKAANLGHSRSNERQTCQQCQQNPFHFISL
jgi:hypothetical protein